MFLKQLQYFIINKHLKEINTSMVQPLLDH